MRHCIDSVLYATWDQEVSVLILSAFGCGVFGNNQDFVLHQFKDFLQEKNKDYFLKVVFAVADEKNFSTIRENIEG